MKRAVFLDKDGTLVEDVPYNVDPARVVLREGALVALRAMADAGYELHVVSNQAGVGLGKFPPEALHGVEARLRELAATAGVAFAGMHWCPHQPDAGCDCRKPQPGLLLGAGREHGLDLGASWMVGDILDDVEAGRRAGCRTIFLDVGNETVWQRGALREPDVTVPSLVAAAEAIA